MASAVACKFCGQVHAVEPLRPGTVAQCCRCGSQIARRTSGSLHLTAALSLAALILYVPANLFPILRIELYGASSENTVWDGAVRLFKGGDYAIGLIVFCASVLVPLLKLIGLFILVISTKFKWTGAKRQRTRMYRFIEAVGRWAMLDVFVVAILVSLVKLQSLATVIPGRGLLSFTGVVVLTVLASASFDPQLIWEGEEPVP